MNTRKFRKVKPNCTTDYSLFIPNPHNRESHDNFKLLESMKKNGFLCAYPIHVATAPGGKFMIVSGHHRFKYAKMLGLPVYFIIDDTPVSVPEMEQTSLSWNLRDQVVGFAREGNAEYQTVLRFQKKHELPLTVAAALVGGVTAGSDSKTRDLKNGVFRRSEDTEHSDRVIGFLDILSAHGDDRLKFVRNKAFVNAVSHALRIPASELSYTKLTHKAQVFGTYLHKRSTYQEYLKELEDLYNRQERRKLPLVIRAMEVGKARQKTFGRQNDLPEATAAAGAGM